MTGHGERDQPRRFESTATEPMARGVEFGESNREEIDATVRHYLELFSGPAALSMDRIAELAASGLAAVDSWAPEIGQEIRGIAQGANQSLQNLAAINSRTEILATSTTNFRGECSTVVHLGGVANPYPETQQNWDWYSAFSNDWLIWSFELGDGRRVETMTEYGIVAKVGCNSSGVGLHFNILHHRDDGRRMGVPVHVVARRVLETSTDAASALQTIASASLSASTTLTVVSGGRAGKVAVSVEASPNDLGFVFPDETGLLVHTNHFLTDPARLGDTEHRFYPDTVLRYDSLVRELKASSTLDQKESIAEALSSRVGGALAVCCQPDRSRPPEFQFETLAHVRLDLKNGRVIASPGGPSPRE